MTKTVEVQEQQLRLSQRQVSMSKLKRQASSTINRQNEALVPLVTNWAFLEPDKAWVWPENENMSSTPFQALVRRGLAECVVRKEGSLHYSEYRYIPIGEKVCTAS